MPLGRSFLEQLEAQLDKPRGIAQMCPLATFLIVTTGGRYWHLVAEPGDAIKRSRITGSTSTANMLVAENVNRLRNPCLHREK